MLEIDSINDLKITSIHFDEGTYGTWYNIHFKYKGVHYFVLHTKDGYDSFLQLYLKDKNSCYLVSSVDDAEPFALKRSGKVSAYFDRNHSTALKHISKTAFIISLVDNGLADSSLTSVSELIRRRELEEIDQQIENYQNKIAVLKRKRVAILNKK